MKCCNHLRLLAISLLTVCLLAAVPPARATVSFDSGNSLLEKLKERAKEKAKEREKDGRRDDRRTQVPDGSDGALLVLAAGALGGGVLVWRRKQRANVL